MGSRAQLLAFYNSSRTYLARLPFITGIIHRTRLALPRLFILTRRETQWLNIQRSNGLIRRGIPLGVVPRSVRGVSTATLKPSLNGSVVSRGIPTNKDLIFAWFLRS